MPPLREEDVDPDPIRQFQRWYDDAEARGVLAPDAMIVASATPDGRPSARAVLLRGLDERGFAFFTNFESRKGRELDANPHAAVLFHWPEVHRQVRATGSIERVSQAESEAYWNNRPRASRISAWASAQSEPIGSRDELEARARTPRSASATVTCRSLRSGVASGSHPTSSSSGSTATIACTTACGTRAPTTARGWSNVSSRERDRALIGCRPMRRSIDDALDDHPADDDERPPVSWAVALTDDCDACGDGELRVVLTVEEAGRAGLGIIAHLAPDTARRLRAAIAAALREAGEDPGP